MSPGSPGSTCRKVKSSSANFVCLLPRHVCSSINPQDRNSDAHSQMTMSEHKGSGTTLNIDEEHERLIPTQGGASWAWHAAYIEKQGTLSRHSNHVQTSPKRSSFRWSEHMEVGHPLHTDSSTLLSAQLHGRYRVSVLTGRCLVASVQHGALCAACLRQAASHLVRDAVLDDHVGQLGHQRGQRLQCRQGLLRVLDGPLSHKGSDLPVGRSTGLRPTECSFVERNRSDLW
jgi:hypothetical protein